MRLDSLGTKAVVMFIAVVIGWFFFALESDGAEPVLNPDAIKVCKTDAQCGAIAKLLCEAGYAHWCWDIRPERWPK